MPATMHLLRLLTTMAAAAAAAPSQHRRLQSAPQLQNAGLAANLQASKVPTVGAGLEIDPAKLPHCPDGSIGCMQPSNFSREDFENDQWEETKHNAKLAAEAVAGIVIAALSFTALLVWTIIKCNTPKRASAAEIRRAAGGHADLTEQGPMGTELGTMGDAGDDGVRSAERL